MPKVLTAHEVQQILEGGLGKWSDLALEGATVVSCQPELLVVRLPVTDRITNSASNLHGGASSTLIDVLSERMPPLNRILQRSEAPHRFRCVAQPPPPCSLRTSACP